MTSNDYLNLTVTVIFLILTVMLAVRWFKLRGKITIPDQQWSTIRILFVVIGALSLLSMFSGSQTGLLDYLRVVATIAAVAAYMLCRDGLGESGLVVAGRWYAWNEVKGWDYSEDKKKFTVYFNLGSNSNPSADGYGDKELAFAKADQQKVVSQLQAKAGHRYKRMKKNK